MVAVSVESRKVVITQLLAMMQQFMTQFTTMNPQPLRFLAPSTLASPQFMLTNDFASLAPSSIVPEAPPNKWKICPPCNEREICPSINEREISSTHESPKLTGDPLTNVGVEGTKAIILETVEVVHGCNTRPEIEDDRLSLPDETSRESP